MSCDVTLLGQRIKRERLGTRLGDSHMKGAGMLVVLLMHQAIPAAPRAPPPGCCGAFARLVSPGGQAFANFVLPGGAGHLPTPVPFASF